MPISLAVAAIIPATKVPWPWSSEASVSSFTKSQPFNIFPFKSGCPASTPESITATFMGSLLFAFSQALSKLVSEMYHWSLKSGSDTFRTFEI